eukprot:1158392-Pelagomonas_calceolata.AAC.16
MCARAGSTKPFPQRCSCPFVMRSAALIICSCYCCCRRRGLRSCTHAAQPSTYVGGSSNQACARRTLGLRCCTRVGAEESVQGSRGEPCNGGGTGKRGAHGMKEGAGKGQTKGAEGCHEGGKQESRRWVGRGDGGGSGRFARHSATSAPAAAAAAAAAAAPCPTSKHSAADPAYPALQKCIRSRTKQARVAHTQPGSGCTHAGNVAFGHASQGVCASAACHTRPQA